MWKLFWDHINEEMELIKNAPILFCVAFLIVFFVAYKAAEWRYGQIIDVLKVQLSLLKGKLDAMSTEEPKQQAIFPLSSKKTENTKNVSHSRKSEIERLLLMLKEVDLELSQMKPEDYLYSFLTISQPEQLFKKRKTLISQLEKLDHPYP